MAQIAVCSWSLRPSSPTQLVQKMQDCGIRAVQLALDPIGRGEWDEHQTASIFAQNQIEIVSGMMAMKGEDYSTLASIKQTGGVRVNAHWPENLAAAHSNAAIAHRLKIPLVTFHAGFLPHDETDTLRHVMLDRLRQIAGVFTARGICVALETGQESATTLLRVLHQLHQSNATIGVNFDPANMILYGMGDPHEAFELLVPFIRQVHIKDALPSACADDWGCEMPVGEGAVDWPRFLELIRRLTPELDLVIERESGAVDVIADVRKARDTLLMP